MPCTVMKPEALLLASLKPAVLPFCATRSWRRMRRFTMFFDDQASASQACCFHFSAVWKALLTPVCLLRLRLTPPLPLDTLLCRSTTLPSAAGRPWVL